jgi:hypothetical protein
MSINPVLNLESFAIQSPNIAPPPLRSDSHYLRSSIVPLSLEESRIARYK